MRLPRLQGVIERRLLINYRVWPETIAAMLPAPFRPQVVHGSAVAGICLIRLGSMRPAGLPPRTGLRSENAAHRIAVEWDEHNGVRTGVYIPRRDSSSWVNVMVGGRLYPGEYERADFSVHEDLDQISVAFAARDGSTDVDVEVRLADALTGSHLFEDMSSASRFFELGSSGYSATRDPGRFDGLRLSTAAWRVDPAHVVRSASSFFDDPERFPVGTVELDCALVMRSIPVSWEPLATLSTRGSTGGVSAALR